MKTFLYLLLVLMVTTSTTCRKDKISSNCYKARLEIKGICMNYTISVIEGNIDTSMVETQWTNPGTGTSYSKAFRLGSVCDFPPALNQGDEFYFTIENTANTDCAVCMAYYPTPKKTLSIKVIPGPCSN